MDILFDERDLQRLLTRDVEAVEKWFRTYSDTLYTFAYYRVGKDAEAAAEVVQETFVQALRKIENYDSQRGSMLVWLTRGKIMLVPKGAKKPKVFQRKFPIKNCTYISNPKAFYPQMSE